CIRPGVLYRAGYCTGCIWQQRWRCSWRCSWHCSWHCCGSYGWRRSCQSGSGCSYHRCGGGCCWSGCCRCWCWRWRTRGIGPDQVFDAIKHLLTITAAHHARAQFELVMHDPESRVAMGTAGCQRHGTLYRCCWHLTGQCDPTFLLGPYRKGNEGRIRCRNFFGLARQYARQYQGTASGNPACQQGGH
ncbi:MAG: hypothetical protein RL748_3076, partial [Pseudomonadota bacterium]